MMTKKEIFIKVMKDGPYLVYGMPEISEKIMLDGVHEVPVKYSDGKIFEVKTDPVSLCRCGNTKCPPFCDGEHVNRAFDGAETASFEPIMNDTEKYEGLNIDLYDNEKYCAYARFCDAHGRIWNLVGLKKKRSDDYVINLANLCPAGRLMVQDKEGNAIEHLLPKSIAILEDDGLKISGPIWVRGGIRIESADGKSYEIRNRQTICRCGASRNKPFCDSEHAVIKFKSIPKKGC